MSKPTLPELKSWPSLWPYIGPKYWPVWVFLGLLKCITWLPLAFGQVCGKGLGWTLYYLAKRRRSIARQNIAGCFPKLNKKQQEQLVKQTFKAYGIGIIESFYTFWGALPNLANRVSIEGMDILQAACAKPEGVLLVTAHFSSLDLAGALFNQHEALVATYQHSSHPLMDAIITRGRGHLAGTIEREKTRLLIKTLKAGYTVWIAPDQDLGLKRSVFAPFFGIQTATATVVSRLAEVTGCQVIFYTHHRTATGYQLQFSSLKNLPSGHLESDAALLNSHIENAINQYPEQYMWLHRRFKTRPEGEVSFYQK